MPKLEGNCPSSVLSGLSCFLWHQDQETVPMHDSLRVLLGMATIPGPAAVWGGIHCLCYYYRLPDVSLHSKWPAMACYGQHLVTELLNRLPWEASYMHNNNETFDMHRDAGAL